MVESITCGFGLVQGETVLLHYSCGAKKMGVAHFVLLENNTYSDSTVRD